MRTGSAPGVGANFLVLCGPQHDFPQNLQWWRYFPSIPNFTPHIWQRFDFSQLASWYISLIDRLRLNFELPNAFMPYGEVSGVVLAVLRTEPSYFVLVKLRYSGGSLVDDYLSKSTGVLASELLLVIEKRRLDNIFFSKLVIYLSPSLLSLSLWNVT